MKYRVHICNLSPHSGSCVLDGKEWRWDFGEYVGVTFLDKRGDPLTTQPGEKHPVWEKFHDWLEALKGPLPWREAEHDIARGLADGTLKPGNKRGPYK